MKAAVPAEAKTTSIRRRALELAAEIAIAVVLVIGIFLFATHTKSNPKQSAIFTKWIPFALNTAFVFGYALKFLHPLWRTPKLSTVMAGLLLLHGIGGWFLIRDVERVPLVWYVPVDMAEIWTVLTVVEWALPDEVGKYVPPPSRNLR